MFEDKIRVLVSRLNLGNSEFPSTVNSWPDSSLHSRVDAENVFAMSTVATTASTSRVVEVSDRTCTLYAIYVKMKTNLTWETKG